MNGALQHSAQARTDLHSQLLGFSLRFLALDLGEDGSENRTKQETGNGGVPQSKSLQRSNDARVFDLDVGEISRPIMPVHSNVVLSLHFLFTLNIL